MLAAALIASLVGQTSTTAIDLPPPPVPDPSPPAAIAAVALPEPEPDPGLPFQYELTLSSVARWQIDNGDRTVPGARDYDPTGENFGDLVSTIGASINYEEFLAAVRIDESWYVHQPIAAVGASRLTQDQLTDRYRDQVLLEYAALSYSDGDLDVTLGDFYVTLARGLVLAIRKVDDVGIDNKLRGGEAKARMGPVTAHAFAGQLNIKNYEPGTGYAYRDPDDLIAGGRLEYRLGKYFKVGTHAMRMRSERQENGNEIIIDGYGASLELPRPVPWASLYAEAARLERNAKEDGINAERIGHGIYGALELELGPTTVLVEGKYYDNLFSMLPGGLATSDRQGINRLSEPPSAERPLALLLSNETVHGGRVKVDLKLWPEVIPYLSIGRYRDGRTIDSNITALFAGARGRWSGGHALLESGYRGQFVDTDDLSDGRVVRTDTHVTVDVVQHLFSNYSAELVINGLRVEEFKPIDETTDWLEGRASLSFISSKGWSATGAWEWYTKTPDQFDVHYLSAGGQWEPTEGWIIRGLYGGERAGLKCSGGVCRFFPGFDGGRLEVSGRF
jgi:hypothetical protein